MQPLASPQTQRLQLAPHVRACCSDGQIILLDLQRSKYLGVGGTHMRALATIVAGWPSCPSSEGVTVTTAYTSALARSLLAQGLLTDRPSGRMPDGLGEMTEATASWQAEDSQGDTIGRRRVYRFMLSALTAAMWLRYGSLLSIARAVAARRARIENEASGPDSLDALRGALGAYDRLRPLLFSARDRCLQDSLALVGFLAREGVLARWIIGVKTRPFGAHSWVQSGGIVLNDQHDHVRRFRPILVV